jgi:hypothetical protein
MGHNDPNDNNSSGGQSLIDYIHVNFVVVNELHGRYWLVALANRIKRKNDRALD